MFFFAQINMSNISFSNFDNNFLTHIRAIEQEHVDETGVYDYGVGFNIVCMPNNRVMYFENHLNSGILPTPHTEQDIVNAAWSNLVPDIKAWSTTALTANSLIGSQWIPGQDLAFDAIDQFTFSIFLNNFTIEIARFGVYPTTDPKSWCVGFTIRQNNSNEYMYIDTQVTVNTFAIQRAEDEILSMAFDKVKNNIGGWASKKYVAPTLINTEYHGDSNLW